MAEREPRYPLLVVDDDHEHGSAVAEFLTELGWGTTYRDGVDSAVEWLQSQGNCVILCDYNMPGANGLELLKRIDHNRSAFVMLTGIHDEEVVAEALRLKADDYVFKPIEDWDTLHKKLMDVADRIYTREQARKEANKLAQMADWQAWKAGFLKQDQERDMQDLLRMLHVHFNQDANFTQILDLLEEVASGDVSKTMRVKVPIDVLNLVVSAMRPIAKFSDGVGIAAALMGDQPRLRWISLRDFIDELKDKFFNAWNELAKVREHRLTTWLEPGMNKLYGRYLEIDKESTFKALNELVVNALKHSDPSAEVMFSLSADRNHVSLAVTNPPSVKPSYVGSTEIHGIPREFEAQAFRLFFRLSTDAQVTIYGEDWPMGLGLPLVRCVFMGAGGEINARNESWHLSGSNEPVLLVTARGSLPLHPEPDEIPEDDDADGDEDGDFEMF